ncbi:uncharacterized protein LOC142573369, partial [Dermacentor variabilis]|uniref:uncharacterized protein LOC142573369 n=1 Tax=Dermacentor variabilis TaxID=34621 RepID=UPI003F5C609C
TALQVHNKWKSLERTYKRAKGHNEKSGRGATRCDFEEELEEVLEREHHVIPTVPYAPGLRTARTGFEETQPQEEGAEPEAEPEAEPDAEPGSQKEK